MKLDREGMSLVEVTVVALIAGIIAAVTVPSYNHVTQRARAAALIEDLRVIGTAAVHYHVQHDRWPADVSAGVVPSELEETLQGTPFEGAGYRLDWDNWTFQSQPTVGVSVLVSDPALEAAFMAAAGESQLWRVGSRYTYVIEGFEWVQ